MNNELPDNEIHEMNFDKDIWSGDKTGQVSQKHQRTSPI